MDSWNDQRNVCKTITLGHSWMRPMFKLKTKNKNMFFRNAQQ